MVDFGAIFYNNELEWKSKTDLTRDDEARALPKKNVPQRALAQPLNEPERKKAN